MPFHRFKDPTYNESVAMPGTIDGIAYDRINVTSEGVGAGGSAPADVAKIGGTNPGTYWVSQSEPALGINANRGMRALAESLDHMDDLFHRDLATPARTAEVVPGGPVATFVITGDVYVGTGTPTEQDLGGLVQILDVNNKPMTVPSGGVFVPVRVTAITNEGGGWQLNPTITLSPSITTGTGYTAVYLERKSPASQADNMLSKFVTGDGYWEATIESELETTRSGIFGFAGVKSFADEVTLSAGVDGGLVINDGVLEVAVGDLAVTLGNVDIVAGTLDVESHVTLDNGNVVVTAGDVNVVAGHVNVTVGDVNVTAGDVNLDAGEVLYNPGRDRSTLHPLFDYVEDFLLGTIIAVYNNHELLSGSPFRAIFPIRLPHGSTLNTVDIQHSQGSSTPNEFFMMEGTIGVNDSTPPVAPVELRHVTSSKGVGTHVDTMANVGLSVVIDNETKLYWVVFESGQANMAIFNITLNWTDVGPGH